jgi:prepilin-type N-terminal cleavage/methylation domain-containing protein
MQKRREGFTLKRKGFTLIELLVVIAIIGLLMVVFMAVLRRPKEQGAELVCTAGSRLIWPSYWLVWLVRGLLGFLTWPIRRLRALLADFVLIQKAWDIHDDYLKLIVKHGTRATSQKEVDKWVELVDALGDYRKALMHRNLDEVNNHRCEMEGILAQIWHIRHRVLNWNRP